MIQEKKKIPKIYRQELMALLTTVFEECVCVVAYSIVFNVQICPEWLTNI